MQQVCKLVILQDLNLQNIEICFTLPRIYHWKFEEDTLCPLGPWGVNHVKQFFFKLWKLHLKVNSTSYFFKKMLKCHILLLWDYSMNSRQNIQGLFVNNNIGRSPVVLYWVPRVLHRSSNVLKYLMMTIINSRLLKVQK